VKDGRQRIRDVPNIRPSWARLKSAEQKFQAVNLLLVQRRVDPGLYTVKELFVVELH
jgi:hypothetical protein